MPRIGPKTDQRLDWDDLRTALFLARAGSIRAAARELGVSHSTILRRVAALEARTGVRLFERKPDGYELTPAGQDVFDVAGQLETLVVALERRVEGRDLRPSGPVRVTLPDPFLPLVLPAVGELRDAYPGVDVTLAADVGLADLAEREADVAIRVASEPPPELVGRRLAVAAVAVYGHEAYLRTRPGAPLEALDWIAWDAGSRMSFERWRRTALPEARVRLRVTTPAALRDAVDAGLGVSAFPCVLGELQRDWRRVHRVREISAPVWILTHRDLRTTTRVRLVRDAIANAIVKRRTVIEGRARRGA